MTPHCDKGKRSPHATAQRRNVKSKSLWKVNDTVIPTVRLGDFQECLAPFAKGGLVCSFLEYTLMRIDYAALKLRLTVRAANILPATAAATGAGKALPICR